MEMDVIAKFTSLNAYSWFFFYVDKLTELKLSY
jgi:hypothetical protein